VEATGPASGVPLLVMATSMPATHGSASRILDVVEPEPDTIRSLAHDMRNLLTAVRGHAELALRGLSPEDRVREDVANVVVVIATVFELVDQLDGAGAPEGSVATDLDTTVSAMRRLLDALLPDHISLEIATHSDRARVQLPRLRCERIVLNLVMNARDAMVDGGELRIGTRLSSPSAVELTVSDTGPGFAQEALDHLFEPGFTTRQDRGGSGRGLANCRRIVEEAGGSIAVESVAGRGAVVRVVLPVVEVDHAPESPADDEASREPAQATPEPGQATGGPARSAKRTTPKAAPRAAKPRPKRSPT
jgi:two-component system, cell cycle sensor histidine kinase and response regulator CckA